MRSPRISLGLVMLTVAFAGVCLAELRGFLAFNTTLLASANCVFFGPTLLTVGNLLVFLLILRVPEVWRTGRLQAGPFWWGFQTVCWAATSTFGLICLALNERAYDLRFWPAGPSIESYLRAIEGYFPGVEWLDQVLFVGMLAILFGVPILVLGVLGGLVAWTLGIEAEVQFRRRRPRGRP